MKIKKYVDETYGENLVRVNYIYSFKKEELVTIQLILKLLLEGTVTQSKRTSLKRNLLKNYDANLEIAGAVISNVMSLTFEITGLDQKLLPKNENVIKNLTNILMDCINNTNILLKNIDNDKFKKAKKMLLEDRELDKNTVHRIIEEAKGINCNYEEDLEKVTLEDLKNVYIKIITKGKRLIQIQTSTEEEANKIEEIVNKNICDSTEDETNIKYKKINKRINLSKKSHLDSTRIDFVLERKTQDITEKELALMSIIANVYNDLMFNVIREQYHLSYNPCAVANISENAIILSANILKENKEITMDLMNKIVEVVKEFEFKDYEMENYLDIITDPEEDDCNVDLYNETFNIENLTQEKMQEITFNDLKEHAKNYEIKLVYYLGGK